MNRPAISATPPAPGSWKMVLPGILWARLPLPFRLDHVNVYALEDRDGWALVDTGIDDADTRQTWERLIAALPDGRPPRRLIVTHYHPDHVGLAGWLCRTFNLQLHMSQTEFLMCERSLRQPDEEELAVEATRLRRLGLDSASCEAMLARGDLYRRVVGAPPPCFLRLVSGRELQVGPRRFLVMSGPGHAPEQVMLYDAASGVLISADHVLPRVSPNIGVSSFEPDGDPLGLYLESLGNIEKMADHDVVVLPGHDEPFTGLGTRIRELQAHHRERLGSIIEACSGEPAGLKRIVELMFGQKLNTHQMPFAISEALAHINRLLHEGAIRSIEAHGTIRWLVDAKGAGYL